MEPIFLAQTGMSEHLADGGDWLRQRSAEARSKGCTHMRATIDEDLQLLLLEGWLERPADEGLPRWQATAA